MCACFGQAISSPAVTGVAAWQPRPAAHCSSPCDATRYGAAPWSEHACCGGRLLLQLCTIFRVPIAIVSLVDLDRQWFKSIQGLPVRETDRSSSFCAWTLLPKNPEVLIVSDATKDDRRVCPLHLPSVVIVTSAPPLPPLAVAPSVMHSLGLK